MELEFGRRSRRDMSPQGRQRTAIMSKETKPNSYSHSYRRVQNFNKTVLK